jgi:phage tail sheath gpL-like
MATISTAVGLERTSRVSGYRIRKGFFNDETPNLPQMIAILGEPNTANEATLDFTRKEIISADEAGQIYGYGSPIHQIMRILRPVGSEGVGGIPTIVFPQEEPSGASAKTEKWTISGTVTKNQTHTIVVGGRSSLDFQSYSYNLVVGDTPGDVTLKIKDALAGVLGCPVTGTIEGDDDEIIAITTKWKGLTANEIKISFDSGDDLAGLTYAKTSTTAGSGTPSIASALSQFGEDWITCVINPYKVASILNDLEQFNGIPYSSSPTGRYTSTIFKPFMAYFGETSKLRADYEALTDASGRVSQVTNVLCPAPGSSGAGWEAAANAVRLFARTMQDTPEKDVNAMFYPDMPVPLDGIIGDMSDYNVRDLLVKKGCSTVTLEKGAYKIQDFVTTYHLVETPLQFSYCRNINLDWNVYDGYRILEERSLRDKVLIRDEQITDSQNAVKLKEWKSVLYGYFEDLAEKALINEPDFSKASLKCRISETNPNRVETFFRYKRTGIARIESTDVEAGF